MIRKGEDGFVVECDICGNMMDEDGRTDGDVAVFSDCCDAGVFIRDYEWGKIGNYLACPHCVEKIDFGGISVKFVKNEGAEK